MCYYWLRVAMVFVLGFTISVHEVHAEGVGFAIGNTYRACHLGAQNPGNLTSLEKRCIYSVDYIIPFAWFMVEQGSDTPFKHLMDEVEKTCVEKYDGKNALLVECAFIFYTTLDRITSDWQRKDWNVSFDLSKDVEKFLPLLEKLNRDDAETRRRKLHRRHGNDVKALASELAANACEYIPIRTELINDIVICRKEMRGVVTAALEIRETGSGAIRPIDLLEDVGISCRKLARKYGDENASQKCKQTGYAVVIKLVANNLDAHDIWDMSVGYDISAHDWHKLGLANERRHASTNELAALRARNARLEEEAELERSRRAEYERRRVNIMPSNAPAPPLPPVATAETASQSPTTPASVSLICPGHFITCTCPSSHPKQEKGRCWLGQVPVYGSANGCVKQSTVGASNIWEYTNTCDRAVEATITRRCIASDSATAGKTRSVIINVAAKDIYKFNRNQFFSGFCESVAGNTNEEGVTSQIFK